MVVLLTRSGLSKGEGPSFSQNIFITGVFRTLWVRGLLYLPIFLPKKLFGESDWDCFPFF